MSAVVCLLFSVLLTECSEIIYGMGTYKSSGSRICRELCQHFDDSFSGMKEYHCHRLPRNDSSGKDNSPTKSMLTCTAKGEPLSLPRYPIDSQVAWRYFGDANVTRVLMCREKKDCKISGTDCIHGMCRCKVGYYIDIRANKCVIKCSKYGDNMTVYKMASIQGFNRRVFINITMAECLHRCKEERGFFCLTVDWGKRSSSTTVCNLSDKGFYDVPMKNRQILNLFFSFGQRVRCE